MGDQETVLPDIGAQRRDLEVVEKWKVGEGVGVVEVKWSVEIVFIAFYQFFAADCARFVVVNEVQKVLQLGVDGLLRFGGYAAQQHDKDYTIIFS